MPNESRFDAELLGAYKNLASPSQEMMSQEAVEKIEAAFDALPEDYREAIALHRIVGMSQVEIASTMGRTEGAVRNTSSTAVWRG